MPKYVIKSEDSSLEGYALFVAEVLVIDVNDAYQVDWDLSVTDCVRDSTKFLHVTSAYEMLYAQGLHEDDWEVVEVED